MVQAKGFVKSALNDNNEWDHMVSFSVTDISGEDYIEKILDNIRQSLTGDQFGNWVYSLSFRAVGIETTEQADKQLESLVNACGQTVLSIRQAEALERQQKLDDAS